MRRGESDVTSFSQVKCVAKPSRGILKTLAEISRLQSAVVTAKAKLRRQARRKTLKAWRYETAQTRVRLYDEEERLVQAMKEATGGAKLYIRDRLDALRMDIEIHEILEHTITQEMENEQRNR